jgi:hypothetical protein
MSKVAIAGNPSGTATFTIESPATNTDRTLVLPDAAGTVIVGTQPAGDVVGTTATQTLTNKTLTSPTLTTPNINSAQVATVSGTAPIFMCRAWCNFDGTTGSGNTIRASGNVSSVTRGATGRYVVNFTTAMPDADYSTTLSARPDSDILADVWIEPASITGYLTTSFGIRAATAGPSAANHGLICAAVFR